MLLFCKARRDCSELDVAYVRWWCVLAVRLVTRRSRWYEIHQLYSSRAADSKLRAGAPCCLTGQCESGLSVEGEGEGELEKRAAFCCSGPGKKGGRGGEPAAGRKAGRLQFPAGDRSTGRKFVDQTTNAPSRLIVLSTRGGGRW